MQRPRLSMRSPVLAGGAVALVAAVAGAAATGGPAEVIGAAGQDRSPGVAEKPRPTKKQVKRIARKQANKRISAREPRLNVNSAATAGNANQLEGRGLRQISMWAVVAASGDVVRSSGGVTALRLLDEGRYKVTFPLDVSQCIYNANAGVIATASDDDNFASRLAMVAGATDEPNKVQVGVAEPDGTGANAPFYLGVQC